MTARRRRSPQQRLREAAVWLVAAACVANVFPIYWMFATALKSEADVFAYPPVWVFMPTLDNYRHIFTAAGFFRPLLNSLFIAAVSTTAAVILGTAAAYGMARFKVGGRFLPLWVLSTRMFPPIVIVVPVFLLLSSLHLLDTYPGLIAVYVTVGLPFVIWLMRGFFLEIPAALEEAAWIDGCDRFQAMVKVVLPLTAPGLAVTSVFVFISTWNEFLLASVITGTATKTAPLAAAQFSSEFGIQWGPMMATGVVVLAPMVVAGLLAQPYIVRGLTLGAVKG
ncbi:MAG: carbohydrate ABC transporter permease [Chloroflexi bacterium]|nr:carbohydrate ABC transporter permease [Chloroflexota bacterium]